MNIKSKGFFSPRNSDSQPITSPAPLVESEIQQDTSKEDEAQISGPELFTEPQAEWVKISDTVWKGPVSPGLQAARDFRYGEFKKQGLNTRTYMGDPKPWALYVETPGTQEINGKQKHLIQGFYPFEREVLKVGQTGKAETVSVIANILNGGLQTHEGPDEFFTFGEKELDQRSKRLIVGEPRSEVPTYGQLAEKVYPEQGNKHFWELRQDKAQIGNIATMHMDKEGNMRNLPETTKQLSETMKTALTYSDYDEVTGFLIPKTFADYRDKLGPLALSKLGRPIGPAVTVFAVIGNAPHLVTWQPFERGTMTTREDENGNPISEGGLPANDLTAILNNGEEQITASAPVPEPTPISVEKPKDLNELLTHATRVDDAVSAVNQDGKEIDTQLLSTPDSPYQVKITSLKNELGQLVASKGKGINFIVTTRGQLPDGTRLSPHAIIVDQNKPPVIYGESAQYADVNGNIMIVFVPGDLNYNDANINEKVNSAIESILLTAIVKQGDNNDTHDFSGPEYSQFRDTRFLDISKR